MPNTFSGVPLAGFSGTVPRPRHMLLLTLWAAVMVLAGSFSLPPLDRDESRFMQATVQMMETGDYIVIRYQDDERNKKPAGIYWLQAASVTLLSEPESRAPWAWRVPSMLGGILAVLFTYLAGCRLFDARTALWGAALLAAGPSFAGEATIAKTDAVLLATVTGAMAALAHLFLRWRREGVTGWTMPVLFWTAIAAGILIKGPITPMISLLTITALALWTLTEKRNPVRFGFALHPVTGGVILALMVVPWAIAIGVATDGRFFTEAIGGDMLGKVNEVQESHDGPFGYYARAVWLFFWPAALFLPLALYHGIRHWRDPGVAFCLAWAVPAWLVFEIASTKLTHYVLPLYPALSLLCAHALTSRLETVSTAWERTMRVLGSAAYILVGAAVCAGILWMARAFNFQGIEAVHIGLAAGLAVLAVTGAGLFLSRRFAPALFAVCLGGAALAWGLFEGMLPHMEALNLTQRLSEALDEADFHPRLDEAPPVALAGYNEPSAVFLLGTDTLNGDGAAAAAWLAGSPGRVAIVDTQYDAQFREAAGTVPLSVIATLDGFNYSNNKADTLTIYRSGSAQE